MPCIAASVFFGLENSVSTEAEVYWIRSPIPLGFKRYE